jgi:hypothetical protein
MARWILIVAAAGALGACGSFSGMAPVDPPREVLGVSAPQTGPADAPGPDAVGMLQWKVGQICTRGYTDPHEAIEPAADDKQLVDWQFQCAPYRIWALDLTAADLWPF